MGLKTIAHQTYVPVIFWAVIGLSLGTLLYVLQGMRSRGMGRLFKLSTHFFLVLFVGEILFTALLLLSDIYRGTYGIFSVAPVRNPYWVAFAATVFVGTVMLFLYGMLIGKYAYRVIRHTLYFKDLPSAFDGFTITQISDVHAGSFTNSNEVQKGIDLINAQKSDVFVFTGDLVNNKAEEIKPWIGHFSQIKAPHGQFSILGNHDYGDYVGL